MCVCVCVSEAACIETHLLLHLFSSTSHLASTELPPPPPPPPPGSTRTGLAVEALQDQLPNARVLYSSATGASEPDNLRYMVRLGSFGYPHIGNMIDVLKK